MAPPPVRAVRIENRNLVMTIRKKAIRAPSILQAESCDALTQS